jgi:integrase
LGGALAPTKEKHLASITDPQEVGALLRAIDVYEGAWITRCALRLAPLVFVRPGELRAAQWAEFDFEKAEWRIPATRMKMRVQHIVPLSTQAIAIMRDLQPLTGRFPFAFPSVRSRFRAMSENTITAALRRMGYSGQDMTGHGFRSMASTLLNEQGWNGDAIERQLAHGERDAVRAAYNYAEHLTERRRMMQAWADYLDQLKSNIPDVKQMRAAPTVTNLRGVREAPVGARRPLNLSRKHA